MSVPDCTASHSAAHHRLLGRRRANGRTRMLRPPRPASVLRIVRVSHSSAKTRPRPFPLPPAQAVSETRSPPGSRARAFRERGGRERGCFLQDTGAFSRLSPRGQMPISGGPALVPAVNLVAYLHPGPPARTRAPLHPLWPSLSLVSSLPAHGRDTQSPPLIPSFVHVTAGASSDRCSLERRLHAIRVACLSAERPMPMSSQEKLGIPCSVAAATQSFHIIATAPCVSTADAPEKSVGMHAASEKASAATGFLPTAILCISLE
jgi:hypothetical protein